MKKTLVKAAVALGITAALLQPTASAESAYVAPAPLLATPFAEAIERESARAGIDPVLFAALVRTESHFRPNAISKSDAIGLAQLKPATAAWWCKIERAELFDPEKNLRCGASYFRRMLDRFGDARTALAAYNRGETRVAREGIDRLGQRYIRTVYANVARVARDG